MRQNAAAGRNLYATQGLQEHRRLAAKNSANAMSGGKPEGSQERSRRREFGTAEDALIRVRAVLWGAAR